MGSPKIAGEMKSDVPFPQANHSGQSDTGVERKRPEEDVAPAREVKEKKEVGEKEKAEGEAEKATVRQTLMSTLLASGVALAIIAVGFVVTKKLRESRA